MTRNLKALGLGLLAMLAISAMAASAARAQGAAVLTTEGTTVTIDGKQVSTGVFQRGPRKFSCTRVEFEAHDTNFNGDSTVFTTGPIFEECEETGTKTTMTMFMNGCVFIFHLIGDAKQPEDTWTATWDLECPGGPARLVLYTAIGHSAPASDHETSDRLCEYSFDDQTGLTTIDLTTEPAGTKVNGVATPRDFLIAHITVGGITSTRSFGAALICGPVNDNTATYTATAEIWGTNAAQEQTGITIST